LLVHIGDPSSNQVTSLESQVIHMIQGLFGQTLRQGSYRIDSVGIYSIARSADRGERTVLINIVQISPAESAGKPDWKIPPERYLPSSIVACSLS
jgi:hypothetical protein